MSDRKLPRLLQTPAVLLLLVWMLIPLGMTLYFSFIRYVLNSLRRPEWTSPSLSNWRGFGNYEFVLKSKDFLFAIQNSLLIVCSILFLTVILGVLIAVLINKAFPGQGIVRVLLISPFFVMPAVNAVLWINMILDPVLGLQGIAVASINDLLDALRGAPVLGWFFSLWPDLAPISFRATQTSAFAVIIMVTWQWTPFAVLIFMTSLQSEDQQQKEAAVLDGANALVPVSLSDPAAFVAPHSDCGHDPGDFPPVALCRDRDREPWERQQEPSVSDRRIRQQQHRGGQRHGHFCSHPRQHRRLLSAAHDWQDFDGIRKQTNGNCFKTFCFRQIRPTYVGLGRWGCCSSFRSSGWC